MRVDMNNLIFICVKLVALFVLMSVLPGCATSNSGTSASEVLIHIDSAQIINPDINGRASPVEIHVYFLKADNGFTDEDYYSLVGSPEQALGQDLVMKESVIIKPDTNSVEKMYVDGAYEYVGIVASFRDLEESQWRDISKRPDVIKGGIVSVVLPKRWQTQKSDWNLRLSLQEKKASLSNHTK